MPSTCFRYEDDATQPRLRDPRAMPHACFSYPAGSEPPALPGLRQMPFTCFSYSVSAPPGPGTPGGQLGFPATGWFSYPATHCFRY